MQQARQHRGDNREPDRRMQGVGLTGSGDQVRRGCFTGRERGGERIAARKCRRDGKRGGRTFVDLRFQAAQDGELDLRIERLDDGRRRLDAGVFTLVDQLGEVLALERALAGEDLVEHQPERVDVAARCDLAARQLLRRHVGGRAGPDRFAREARESEIGQPDLAGAVEHDVRGLEVAVDDVALVRGGQAGTDLSRDLERALLGETSDAAQERRQILAVDVLHRQERAALDLVDVVDAAHVRVRHLPRHPDFGVQLRQPGGIAIDAGRQEFERDRLSELDVVGTIDLAHAAFAEALDDPVAFAEQRARLKAPVIDRAGRGEPPGGRGRPRFAQGAIRGRPIGARRPVRVGREPRGVIRPRQVFGHHGGDGRRWQRRAARRAGLAGLLRENDGGAGGAGDVGHGFGGVII